MISHRCWREPGNPDMKILDHEVSTGLGLVARATNFMIDRIFFAKDTSTIDEYSPESPLVGGTTYAMWLEIHSPP